MTFKSQEIATAMRCKPIIGSFEGATRVCSCESPSCCKLSPPLRMSMKELPQAIKATQRNRKEYEKLHGATECQN